MPTMVVKARRPPRVWWRRWLHDMRWPLMVGLWLWLCGWFYNAPGTPALLRMLTGESTPATSGRPGVPPTSWPPAAARIEPPIVMELAPAAPASPIAEQAAAPEIAQSSRVSAIDARQQRHPGREPIVPMLQTRSLDGPPDVQLPSGRDLNQQIAAQVASQSAAQAARQRASYDASLQWAARTSPGAWTVNGGSRSFGHADPGPFASLVGLGPAHYDSQGNVYRRVVP